MLSRWAGLLLVLGALGCPIAESDDESGGTHEEEGSSSEGSESSSSEHSEDSGAQDSGASETTDVGGDDRTESGDPDTDDDESGGEAGDSGEGESSGPDDGDAGSGEGSDSGPDGDDEGSGTDDGSDSSEDGGDSGDGGDPPGLRLNHMQVKGSHNSYHVAPAVPLHDSHRYTHAPLDTQLADQGVRAFELDLHLESDGFHVYHLAVIDPNSTCDRLEDCLSTLKGWSDVHQDHVPIVVWFEIKDENGGMVIDDLAPVDTILEDIFPPDRLFTPDDLAGAHDSPRARVEAEGWPIVDSVRGQFIFVVLDAGGVAEDYSDGYTTLEGRAMFVRASDGQFQDPWAVFSKIDDPASASVADAIGWGLMTASNICTADEVDAACEVDRAAALQSGTHMVKDDFPAPVDGRDYWLDFVDGNPVRCNDVTAPAECTAEDLESL